MEAMNKLLACGTVSEVVQMGDVIDVHVPPPAEVGSFSEEERSRQVRYKEMLLCYFFSPPQSTSLI